MFRICMLLAAGCAALVAGGNAQGLRAQFVGGTLTGIEPKSAARLDLSDTEILMIRCGGSELRISYRKINTLEYGQNVSRRYAAAVLVSPILLLSKSRKHFLTMGYVDDAGNQQAIVLRVEKGDIRALLSGLEARTGRRVEFQDNEARKTGK